MGLHRTFSDELERRNGGMPISFAQKAGSSMVGGALAVCVGTPMDVALVRMLTAASCLEEVRGLDEPRRAGKRTR